jgi:uridine kinase
VTRPFFVGIAGGTGSGKTTVARAIRAALPRGACTILDHDAYYLDLAHLSIEERAKTNFDDPASLDNERLCLDLDQLRAGRAIEKPIYNFAAHTRRHETETIAPCEVIVVEGILVLAHPGLRERFDLRVFVDTDADLRILRRVRRDMEERGRTFGDIRSQYVDTVRPMHEQHVEPSRRFAHLIVPEGGENRVAIDAIAHAVAAMARVSLVSRD